MEARAGGQSEASGDGTHRFHCGEGSNWGDSSLFIGCCSLVRVAQKWKFSDFFRVFNGGLFFRFGLYLKPRHWTTEEGGWPSRNYLFVLAPFPVGPLIISRKIKGKKGALSKNGKKKKKRYREKRYRDNFSINFEHKKGMQHAGCTPATFSWIFKENLSRNANKVFSKCK